jgi:hypothetical protein
MRIVSQVVQLLGRATFERQRAEGRKVGAAGPSGEQVLER